MKYFMKKIHFFLFFIAILLTNQGFSKDTNFNNSKENISNYISGILSLNQNNTIQGFNYLSKTQSLKKIHSNYNVQFIRTLVLLEKFDQAYVFTKSIWNENEFFFEADLLLGLESYIKKDYLRAEKYFNRLNKFSRYNLIFDDFFGNILISWIRASENNKKESFKYLDKIPERYDKLKKIQNSLLHCYFDTPKTEVAFEQLIGNKKNESSFSRYNYFLANHLISKEEILAAEVLIGNSSNLYNSNLLIRQSDNFIQNGNTKKIKNFFNCKNTYDNIAEIFYVVANLYATEKNFQLSNFYLKISQLLNKKFTPNTALLAENFLIQKKYKEAKKIYNSLKSVGPVYSWHASISLASISTNSGDKEKSISILEKELSKIPNPNFEHYYELANFCKQNQYYEKSIKYYSLTLKNIKHDHYLIPKIFDKRGTSYERLGNWDKAEKDLLKSLEILPDQPHVLNYLAYSWIEKRVNVDKSISMLKKANSLKENDGYIIDSLGWAYYVDKKYTNAEKFLQKAVEILPLDPIINDHYADTLWMLNKPIQARYIWKHVLNLDTTKKELKDNINKKLIFGITSKL